ncbi:uncharacterized protein LOC116201273 [Punica granatum]|uniref:Uncharacterized protein LOC116201273 n=1 Tax=Punica granatum TaxID=22663 RepID=A0A6P8CUA7_PUNGR|nr:uncharacterized protein LOC116201273 [Punica granatum]
MEAAAEFQSTEAAEGVEPSGIVLAEILPPRLEDAGLEDCALPLDSIHEAFLKAATAVGSRGGGAFASDDEDDDEDESGAPEESGDRTGNPSPATSDDSEVAIERESVAEDGDSGGTATRKGVDEEACAAGLQRKLEIQ